METAPLFRSFEPDLEIRSAAQGGDGRTIVGIAVPYGRAVPIPSERIIEQFGRGAFNHQLRAAHRVKFGREHIGDPGRLLGGVLIGATKLLRDDAAGLYGEWRVSATPTGDDTLELVKDGALRHLSVGFIERRNRTLPGGITERVKADLREVVVTMEGAYGELATVSGVRSAGAPGADLGPDLGADLDAGGGLIADVIDLDEARRIVAAIRPLPLP